VGALSPKGTFYSISLSEKLFSSVTRNRIHKAIHGKKGVGRAGEKTELGSANLPSAGGGFAGYGFWRKSTQHGLFCVDHEAKRREKKEKRRVRGDPFVTQQIFEVSVGD